jgi:hypothetical protein
MHVTQYDLFFIEFDLLEEYGYSSFIVEIVLDNENKNRVFSTIVSQFMYTKCQPDLQHQNGKYRYY